MIILVENAKKGMKVFMGIGTETILKIIRTQGRLKGINDDQILYHVYMTSGYKLAKSKGERLDVMVVDK